MRDLSVHPNLLDKLAKKIYSGYLYPGQLCQTDATVNVGIIHKLPDIKPFWKIMDYLYVKKGCGMRFLGLARDLNISGDVLPSYSIMELVNPVVDEKKSFGKELNHGDLICITPYDRRFLSETVGDTRVISGLVFPEAEP
jgi:hypothetical protein